MMKEIFVTNGFVHERLQITQEKITCNLSHIIPRVGHQRTELITTGQSADVMACSESCSFKF
jgi:hypothetical protein